MKGFMQPRATVDIVIKSIASSEKENSMAREAHTIMENLIKLCILGVVNTVLKETSEKRTD
jgi:hypothetical protein